MLDEERILGGCDALAVKSPGEGFLLTQLERLATYEAASAAHHVAACLANSVV